MDSYAQIEIYDFGVNGEGVGKCGELVVFVEGAVPGDIILAELYNFKKSFAFGKIIEFVRSSESRLKPECAAFSICGGCSFLHVEYETELAFKKKKVNDALKRIGGLEFEIDEIVGMEQPFNYRNKAIYHVSGDKGKARIGFYGAKTNEIAPMDGCIMFDAWNKRIISAFKHYIKESGAVPYDIKTGRGLIRALMIRRSSYTGDILVCISTCKGSLPNIAGLVYSLTQCCKHIKGITQCVTKGSSEFDGDFRFVWGDDYIIDKIGACKFKISSGSFFQVNPSMTPLLYEKALEYAEPSKEHTVLDVYAGTGAIANTFAKAAGAVIGIELNKNAVLDAEENVALNGFTNIQFIQGDAAGVMSGITEAAPHTVILDPPRSGCGKRVVDELGRLSPSKIVYISCNPATLARDLRAISQLGYAVDKGACLDMFPRCAHVETVVLISKR